MADSPLAEAEGLRILPRHEPKPKPGRTFALREARAGQEVRLLALQLPPADRDHFYSLGLLENRLVRVLHNDHRGRVMLRLGDELFLLGRLETPRVRVREIVYV